jgi:hypothetical protein
MGTTSRGYPYPEVTDDVRPHEDIQALAASVNTDVGTLEGKHCGRIVQTVTQALADNTLNMVIFSGADVMDYGNAHNPASNNTRVTPTKAGVYRFHGNVAIGAMTTPVFSEAYFRKNGTTALEGGARSAGAATTHSQDCSALVAMNGTTDYIELATRQDSAGAGSTQVSLQYTSVLEWEWVRPL